MSDVYFEWLVNKVDPNHMGDREVLKKLYERPFTWKKRGNIARDENRAIDGLVLRKLYLKETGLLLGNPPAEATVLEVLVALSINIDNGLVAGNGDQARWFWLMVDNLGLTRPGAPVNYILNRWLAREFNWNGEGSPFPLQNCKFDQRRVELWLQACGYFSEPIEREERRMG